MLILLESRGRSWLPLSLVIISSSTSKLQSIPEYRNSPHFPKYSLFSVVAMFSLAMKTIFLSLITYLCMSWEITDTPLYPTNLSTSHTVDHLVWSAQLRGGFMMNDVNKGHRNWIIENAVEVEPNNSTTMATSEK